MKLEISAEDAKRQLEHYNSVLNNYSKRISKIDSNSYFSKNILSNLLREFKQEFDIIFGFKSSFKHLNDFIGTTAEPRTFSNTLLNTIYRRTYFYLSKFQHEFDPKKTNKALNDLILELKKYRRIELYGIQQAEDFLLKIDPSYSFALAPLYETFIDPELFTTLLFLNEYIKTNKQKTKDRKEKEKIEKIITLLTQKLIILLKQFLNEDFSIRGNELAHHKLKDEANLLWGICTLWEIQKENFSIFDGGRGIEEFGNAINTIASKTDWIMPNDIDIVLEVTPEIITEERSHLYIAINLLNVLRTEKNILNEESSTQLFNIINKYIMHDDELTGNLYTQSMRYACLREYVNFLGSIPSSDKVKF